MMLKHPVGKPKALLGIALLLTTLASCGGSGGGSNSPPPTSNTFEPGVFEAAEVFFNQCANPPAGNNTQSGQAYGSGSRTDENNWLRSWSNDLYLWYDEITDQNPAEFSTPDYFELMKTTATTPSGNPRDRFHFSIPTPEYLASAESGVVAGYGSVFTIINDTPPRDVAIAYINPNTPASAAGLARGARILTIDGEDVVNGSDIDTLNAGLFPATSGESHTFEVRDLGASTTRTITMVSAEITTTPVQNVRTLVTDSGTVGYLTFHDHILPAENQLIDAVGQLSDANIDDLVLDLRYNGGGFLFIASQLAYMIAGPTATNNSTFEGLRFNDKHPDIDPVLQEPLEPIPFYNTESSASANPLPSLNLSRVYVITSGSTCSASESIINGLRGVGVEVIQIGENTCGKPYGFYPTDNCGTTYFSIQFQGENNAGFGDYPDGFSPQNASSSGSVSLPGCEVGDDFSAALGDTSEARLAAALEYRESGSCPLTQPVSANADGSAFKAGNGAALGPKGVQKPVWLQNRMLGGRGY